MKRKENQSVEQLHLFEEDNDSSVAANDTLSCDDQSEPIDAALDDEKLENGSIRVDNADGILKATNDDASNVEVVVDSDIASEESQSSICIQPLEVFQKKLQDQEQEKQSSKNNKKETNVLIEILDIIRSVVVWFFITWLVATFVAKPIRIDGTSMYPTLHHGDYGFSNIIGLHFGDIKRFEVVVVFEPWLDDFVIKRIIALPGETISYRDNQLYINGEVVDEPFFDEEYTTSMMSKTNDYFTNDFSEVTLGEDEYFIMGDNRPKSSDSREYGPIKSDQIISKSTLILFPFQNIGVH